MQSLIGTRRVKQIGLIVRDIEKASASYAAFLGVEKSPIIFSAPTKEFQSFYKGMPSTASCKLAFYPVGEYLILELIEPVEGTSVWSEFLSRHGEGVHHITVVVRDTQAVEKKLKEEKMPLIQKGEFEGGNYAYFDTLKELHLMLNTNQFN